MEIRCISLKRASWRRERMAARFSEVGVSVVFFDAVDGQALREESIHTG